MAAGGVLGNFVSLSLSTSFNVFHYVLLPVSLWFFFDLIIGCFFSYSLKGRDHLSQQMIGETAGHNANRHHFKC